MTYSSRMEYMDSLITTFHYTATILHRYLNIVPYTFCVTCNGCLFSDSFLDSVLLGQWWWHLPWAGVWWSDCLVSILPVWRRTHLLCIKCVFIYFFIQVQERIQWNKKYLWTNTISYFLTYTKVWVYMYLHCNNISDTMVEWIIYMYKPLLHARSLGCCFNLALSMKTSTNNHSALGWMMMMSHHKLTQMVRNIMHCTDLANHSRQRCTHTTCICTLLMHASTKMGHLHDYSCVNDYAFSHG